VLLIVGLFIDSFNVKSKKKQLDEQNKKLENAVENLQQEINNLFEDLYDNETATGLKNLDIKKQGFESFDEALDYALEKWSKEDFADRYSIFKTALDNYEKFKNSFDEKVSNQLNLA
jgi:predicted nuclease with TOPRIM domain